MLTEIPIGKSLGFVTHTTNETVLLMGLQKRTDKKLPVVNCQNRLDLGLLLALCLIGTTAILGGAAQKVAADHWPQFRGNHRLTGITASDVPKELQLLWTYEAGESIESSAAIEGGTIFVGSQAKELLAVDLETGKLRWKYSTKEGIGESSPSVSDGVVYVGDLLGILYAVRATDGKELWTFATEGEIKSSPVVIDDKVLIGSYDEHLYSLSARDGKLLWKVRTEGPVHCTPGIRKGIAYVAGCDEVFRAIDLSTGKQAYEIPSGAYTGASPALLGDAAYFGTFNNDVLSISLTGKYLVWRYEHSERQFPFYSSAAVVENKMVLGGRDKMIHCLNIETGEAIWTFRTRARVESSPAIADTRVFVGSNDGRFYVLDLNTGEKLWEFEAGAPLSASPAIASGRIVIGSQDGVLYCFGNSN